MALSVNWSTKVVTIPQADLTVIGGSIFGLNLDTFRLALKAVEASDDGMAHPDIHRHTTEVILSGVTYARFVEIINGYTVTFEDGQYGVNLSGANTNLLDVLNRNQVSIAGQNSAGLIVTSESVDLSQVLANQATILVRLNADEELAANGTWTALEAGTATVLSTKQYLEDLIAGTKSLKE